MKRLILAACALASLSSVALASCPPGTTYNCYTTYNGKQSCGCR